MLLMSVTKPSQLSLELRVSVFPPSQQVPCPWVAGIGMAQGVAGVRGTSPEAQKQLVGSWFILLLKDALKRWAMTSDQHSPPSPHRPDISVCPFLCTTHPHRCLHASVSCSLIPPFEFLFALSVSFAFQLGLQESFLVQKNELSLR